MSSVDPSPSRPARVAGLALIAVAAIAAVIGVVSLFGWGPSPVASGNNTPASQTGTASGSSSADPGTSASTAPTSAQPPTTSAPDSTAPTTSAPAPTTGGPTTQPPTANQSQPGNPPPIAASPVRVYNNSTIPRLAAMAADDLRGAGWDVIDVGNYSQGQIPTTTVYFRPGTSEQDAANRLGARVGARVEPRFDGIASASPGIIFIVTNDYKGMK
ncbi:LytR family transcriptional regulator [Solihabitans fulvus]|uniref:LytR family transcriptional regulator n=1 Tax=Solihabitans fulvus TaxID=1892852 RepID=A0A5B2XGE9_9PSEU|nr:LytR C-terminal domain-containing protein [Solihabitans fulvus]KAA2262423.1 LytR family transcriptional regulator [Solihabitans fulvus]